MKTGMLRILRVTGNKKEGMITDPVSSKKVLQGSCRAAKIEL